MASGTKPAILYAPCFLAGFRVDGCRSTPSHGRPCSPPQNEAWIFDTEASQAVRTTDSGQAIPLWLWWPGEDLKQWEP